MLALKDLAEWISSHDEQGLAIDGDRECRGTQNAEQIRLAISRFTSDAGDDAAADRLPQEGPGGYPGLDEVKHACRLLGCDYWLACDQHTVTRVT